MSSFSYFPNVGEDLYQGMVSYCPRNSSLTQGRSRQGLEMAANMETLNDLSVSGNPHEMPREKEMVVSKEKGKIQT